MNFKHDFSRCWGCNIEDWVWDSFSCSSRAELRVKVCLDCHSTVTGWSSSRFRVFTRLGLGPMLHWCQWHRDVLPSAQLQLFTILHLLLLLFSPLQPALSLYISWLTSVSVCVSRRNIFNWISNFILTWNSIYKGSRKEKENGTFLLDTRENIFSKFEFKVKFVASLPESDSWWCPGSRHLLS